MEEFKNISDSELNIGKPADSVSEASVTSNYQLTYPLDPITVKIIKDIVSSVSSTSITGRSHGSGTTSISAGTDTKMTFSVNDFANGITWDSGNNQFVVITARRYIITGTTYYSSITNSGKAVVAKIFKNGSSIAQAGFGSVASGNLSAANVTDIQNLSVGDTIALYTFQNDSVSNSVSNGLSYLSIAAI